MTGKDKIEAAAAANGWTAVIDHEFLSRVYRKPNSQRMVRVYFGCLGQVIDATTTTASRVRNVLGTGKAQQVIEFIND